MDAQFNSWNYAGVFTTGRHLDQYYNSAMDVDLYMGLAMDSQLGIDTPASPTDLFNSDFLKQLAEAYYRQHAAIISKQVLLEPASIETTGYAVVMENRLVVRDWAQSMVGLIMSCLALSAIALYTIPTQGIPRDPSCIPNMAALLLHSHNLQTRLRDLSATVEKDLIRGLARYNFQLGSIRDPVTEQAEVIILDQQQHYGNTSQDFIRARLRSNPHPRILHPNLRLVICSILLALIIGLNLLLQKSNRDDGLRDVVDDKYIHYLWTTTPALILGAITIVVSSMDFQIRSLAPYMMLKGKITSKRILKLDHLDMSVPHAMYREFKLGNVGALATSTTMLIASTFALFSGSLFQALAAPNQELVTLRANQSFFLHPFDNEAYEFESAGTLASLILESNLSYPRFTDKNLALPSFLTGKTMASNSTLNLSNVPIEAVVPAIRGKVDCRLYNSSQHRLDFNDTTADSGGKEEVSNSLSNCISRSCSDLLYTWGKISPFSQPVVQHIASAGCNVSLEGLDVDVTLLGTDFRIDTSPQKAPRPRKDTIYDVPMGSARDRSQTSDYRKLTRIRAGQDLDSFFSLLVSSQFAIPISDLGDEAADAKVFDAIRFQHGIIQAQNLGNSRASANNPNATTLATNSSSRIGLDDEGFTLYNATATDTSGQRRRIKQDPASTRALQGLLGASLVLLIISWLFTYRETNVLPRPPTSIASVAALIAAGNLLSKLPPDAQRLDREAFAAALGVGSGEKMTKYWIGWRTVPDLENGGKTRRFGIFAVEEGDDDEDEEPTEGSEGEGDSGGEDEAAGGGNTASVDDSQ
ncbi:hypothetical protein PG988_010293 [Apiospora saccharicola]